MDRCCFCIKLRIGALLIAFLGIFFYSFICYVSFSDELYRSAFYYFIMTIICFLGFIGALLENVTLVQTFTEYYVGAVIIGLLWVVMALIFGSILVALIFSLKSIVEICFCSVILDYHQTLSPVEADERLVQDEEASPPSYGTTENPV